jgi:uncharacterized protein (DUF488 family)
MNDVFAGQLALFPSPGTAQTGDCGEVHVPPDRLLWKGDPVPVITTPTPAVSIGYEGQDVDQFVSGLVASGVEIVVDVRLTPISRKRGFSKTALAAHLAARGIGYLHVRALGNPKSNRAGFAGDTTTLLAARARYAELLSEPDATVALDDLAVLAGERRIAVMCFEADQHRCHRHVVLAELCARCGSGTA